MVLQQSQKEANLVAEIPEKRVQHMLFLEIVLPEMYVNGLFSSQVWVRSVNYYVSK